MTIKQEINKMSEKLAMMKRNFNTLKNAIYYMNNNIANDIGIYDSALKLENKIYDLEDEIAKKKRMAKK